MSKKAPYQKKKKKNFINELKMSYNKNHYQES